LTDVTIAEQDEEGLSELQVEGQILHSDFWLQDIKTRSWGLWGGGNRIKSDFLSLREGGGARQGCGVHVEHKQLENKCGCWALVHVADGYAQPCPSQAKSVGAAVHAEMKGCEQRKQQQGQLSPAPRVLAITSLRRACARGREQTLPEAKPASGQAIGSQGLLPRDHTANSRFLSTLSDSSHKI